MRRIFIALIILVQPCFGETFSSGDWAWTTDTNSDGFYYALTVNDSGHFLGQYCYFESENCMYLLNIDIGCEPESEYPALINSDAGAFSLILICYDLGNGDNAFYMSSFDDVNQVVLEALRMGIVVPLQSDEFKVSRFSLIGSNQAIEDMREATQSRINKNSLRNISLPDSQIL